MLGGVEYPEPTGPHAHFARALMEGMRRSSVTQTDIANETRGTADMKSAMEKVRLWMRGERMARDKDLKRVAKMIGLTEADLRYPESEKPTTVMPQLNGEHVTDADELALLRAYRGLGKEWARNALRKRAVELLEEFGPKGVHNPWAGTQ